MINLITSSFAQKFLDVFIAEGKFLSLHYKHPNYDQPSLTEPAFGGYERQGVSWGIQGSGYCANIAPVQFVGLEPPVTVAAIGVCGGQFGSNLLTAAVFDEPVTSGLTTYVVPAGFLSFRVM